MADWNDEELGATVAAYFDMLAAERAGVPYSKAEARRRLLAGPLSGRSGPSIEYRMRNISAVLERHGRKPIAGYLPARNVGEAVSASVWEVYRQLELEREQATALTETPIIYFNIGWMRDYRGPSTDDPTQGAHGYLANHTHGAESYNFMPAAEGVVRGYRPLGERERTNITRLGAAPQAELLKGVLVVWLAREPASKRTLIVGWYKNATVFRLARDTGIVVNGESIHCSAEARASDAKLLPPIARTFEVQSSRSAPGLGFGQKPTWFGASHVDALVRNYIQSISERRERSIAATGSSVPRNTDPELRRDVERAAVKHATEYFQSPEGGGRSVVSVEAAARGWDLEASTPEDMLLVEVKGLLGSKLRCELTPNEYAKTLIPELRDKYVIYVVNNALTKPPGTAIASIFRYENGLWRSVDGRVLQVTARPGAVLTCP